MNPAAQTRIWILALAGGGAVLLMAVGALRVPLSFFNPMTSAFPPLSSGPALSVHWSAARSSAFVAQSAQLMDPTPLFMPSALSAENKDLVGRGIGEKFPALISRDDLKFRVGDLRLDRLPPPVAMPAGPAEALAANPPGNLAMGFGRSDQTETPLPLRQAWLSVRDAATGKIVFSGRLPVGAVPDLPGSNWEPIYFSATVNASGLVGSVIPMPGPPPEGGFLALDLDSAEAVANYLETKLRLGQHLAPGFYRISVGP